jgi:hypothetical protein
MSCECIESGARVQEVSTLDFVITVFIQRSLHTLRQVQLQEDTLTYVDAMTTSLSFILDRYLTPPSYQIFTESTLLKSTDARESSAVIPSTLR